MNSSEAHARIRLVLRHLMDVVDGQSEDPSLWFVGDKTAPEAHLQRALRDLHAAVEETESDIASILSVEEIGG